MLQNYQSTIFVIILFIGMIFVFYTLLYYSYDKTLQEDDEKLAEKLKDGPLQSLLNGSGINNIPKLNLITTNSKISKANKCGHGPIHIGNEATNHDCVKICSNSSAYVINVKPDESYIYETTILKPGAHCTIGKRPECDMATSVAIMTVNSTLCRSKFPNIVGGSSGTTIVACSNQQIYDPHNYLWDYKMSEAFNPWTTTITDEDELLNDGHYRFRCKFEGTDNRGNYYQEHPFNRFHPISNYCAALIYGAHPDVKTVIKDDGTFECDCGNKEDTRVENIHFNDKSSQCFHDAISTKIESEKHETMETNIPYKCFTLFSPLEDVGKYLPCPTQQFTNETAPQWSTVRISVTKNEKILIEHPMYKTMSKDGVQIRVDATRFPDP